MRKNGTFYTEIFFLQISYIKGQICQILGINSVYSNTRNDTKKFPPQNFIDPLRKF